REGACDMGERRGARLTIGGAVSRHALAEALETLTGFQLDECLEDEGVVIEDPEASWGGFSELEAWLEARGIPFDLESGPAPAGGPTGPSTSAPTRGRVEFVAADRHAA